MGRRLWRRVGEPEFDSEGRRLRLKHPPELIDRLAEAQNWRCCHCGGRLGEPQGCRDAVPSLEHVVPFSKDGADDETNLVVAHRGCNERWTGE